ncbi:zinc protease [Minicystis rosea]|nr:zinc protease [Minicystis rosea]
MVNASLRALPLLFFSIAACNPPPGPRFVAPLRYGSTPAAPVEPFRAIVPDAAPVTPSIALRWHTSTLPNGLRIAIHERRGVPTVAVQLVFARGSAEMPGQVDTLGTLGRILDISAQDVKLAQLGATQQPFISMDGSGIGARGASSDAAEIIALVAETASRPNLAPPLIKDVKARWSATFHAGFSINEAVMRNALAVTFGNGHPYSFVRPHKDHIDALGAEQVAAAHARLFHPGHALLVVVGDVDAAAIQAAAQPLGEWKPAAASGPRLSPPTPWPSPASIVIVEARLTQTKGAVVGRGPGAADPDYAAFAVLTRALGGRSSRLREEVRVERGAAYDFGSDLIPMRAASLFMVKGAFEPEKAAPALDAILASIKEARTHGMPAADVERAKATLIADWRSAIASTAGLASLAAGAFTEDAPLESITDYPARIAAVTGAQVQRAAARWMAASELRVVVVGDAATKAALSKLGLGEVATRDVWGER